MADAKKGAGSSKKLTAALRALSVEDLAKKLAEEQEKLMRDRFSHATAALENTSLLRKTRRQIARIETVLKEKKQGAANERA